MRKIQLRIITALLILLISLPGVALAKYASFVIDADSGEIYHAVNEDTRNYPASLTKIMTLYMVFEALENKRLRLHQKLPVSRAATRARPSKLNLRKGDRIKVEDAILALVTKSANDVAIVVAEGLAGSEKEFARRMTARARALGMTNTTFKNASGLPNRGQMSTARDMAILGMKIREDFPQYYRYFNTWKFSYQGRKYYNHNKLLKSYDGTDGIKTGFINASGFNLVASVERNGRRVVGVVFGGRTGKSRNAHMKKLMNKAFRKILIASIRPAIRPTLVNGELPIALNGEPAKENPFEQIATSASSETAAIIGENSVAAVTSPRLPTTEDPSPEKGANNLVSWGIQVGAFTQKFRAQQAARKAAVQVRDIASNIQIVIAKERAEKQKQGLYKARLVGFTEPQARHACNVVIQAKLACLPLVLEHPDRLAMRFE
ncbi:D-alanyl-D-alanine carboxypeptidase family protein [Aestuariispira insulae]|uniref:D-alanyl-D-alanine carboxypeptidase n=1 Tax=Aestuariispira insulae TaxID=1461337 RepID=A0A3D9HWZ5_9PROT|nr:D-alanyl-D-alanine carboxypeptidase family protein [Aestuariispira insulae]RED53911.1 D-alanyl-D-alanine carboxypeptidase [Aestuariispira insulae]